MSLKNSKGANKSPLKKPENSAVPKKTAKKTSKKSSKNSKKSLNFTKIFIIIFVLVMLGWAVLMAFVSMPKSSPFERTKSKENIHQILESKKRKTSILEANQSTDKREQSLKNSSEENKTNQPNIQSQKAPENSNLKNSTPENSSEFFKDGNKSNLIEQNITDDDISNFGKKIEFYKNEFISANKTQKEDDEKPIFTAAKDEYKITPEKTLNSYKKANPKSPKLVIIMDDISTSAQASELKNLAKLGIKVTPSIFPPENAHPNSHELANEFSAFMVHLPLWALNYNNEKANTLHKGDSKEKIKARIAQIKRDFPKVNFINNHTGSGFTSDYEGSFALLEALKAQNINFIDSLTIGSSRSQIPVVSAKLGLKYIYRDVFLDNEQNTQKILTMLQKAVNIAKSDGVAIAICHPYKSTFEALRQAKNSVLKGVEVVYVDKIYEFYK